MSGLDGDANAVIGIPRTAQGLGMVVVHGFDGTGIAQRRAGVAPERERLHIVEVSADPQRIAMRVGQQQPNLRHDLGLQERRAALGAIGKLGGPIAPIVGQPDPHVGIGGPESNDAGGIGGETRDRL